MPTLTPVEQQDLAKILEFIRANTRLPNASDKNEAYTLYNAIEKNSATDGKLAYQMALIYKEYVDASTIATTSRHGVSTASNTKDTTGLTEKMHQYFLSAAIAGIPEAIKWVLDNNLKSLSNENILKIVTKLTENKDEVNDESKQTIDLLLTTIVDRITKNVTFSTVLSDKTTQTVDALIPFLETHSKLLERMVNVRNEKIQTLLVSYFTNAPSKQAFHLYRSFTIQIQTGSLFETDKIKEAFEPFKAKATPNEIAIIDFYIAATCIERLKKSHEPDEAKTIFKVITDLLTPLTTHDNNEIKTKAEKKLAEFHYQQAMNLADQDKIRSEPNKHQEKIFKLLKKAIPLYPKAYLELAKILFDANITITAENDYLTSYLKNQNIPFDEKITAIKKIDFWNITKFTLERLARNHDPEAFIVLADACASKLCATEIEPLVRQHMTTIKWHLIEPTALTLYKKALFKEGNLAAVRPFVEYYNRMKALTLTEAVDRLLQGYFETEASKVMEPTKKNQVKLAIFEALKYIGQTKITGSNLTEASQTAIILAKVYFCSLHELENNPELAEQFALVRQQFIRQAYKFPDKFKETISYAKNKLATSIQHNHKLAALLDALEIHAQTNTAIPPADTKDAAQPKSDHFQKIASLISKRNALQTEAAQSTAESKLTPETAGAYLMNSGISFSSKIKTLNLKKGLLAAALEYVAEQTRPNGSTFAVLADAYAASSYDIWGGKLFQLLAEANPTNKHPKLKKYTVTASHIHFYKIAAFQFGSFDAVTQLHQYYITDIKSGGLTAFVQRLQRAYCEVNKIPTPSDQKATKDAVLKGLLLVALTTHCKPEDINAIAKAQVLLVFFHYLSNTNQSSSASSLTEIIDIIACKITTPPLLLDTIFESIKLDLKNNIKQSFNSFLVQLEQAKERVEFIDIPQLEKNVIAKLEKEISTLEAESHLHSQPNNAPAAHLAAQANN